MGERLYRDEIGAAVERVRQLEEENAELRAEIDRLKDPPPPASPSPTVGAQRARSIGACAMLTGVAFAMLVGTLATSAGGGHYSGSRCFNARTSKRVHTVA